MKNYASLTAALLGAVSLVTAVPSTAQTRTRNHNSLSISMQGNAESCSDLKVTSDGQLAQAVDKFSLSRGDASMVELNAADHGVISVRGWNQSGYSVEACKVAVAEDKASAERTLSAMSVSHSGGRFTFTGPQNDSNNWQVYFIVHAPANAALDLLANNGPISVTNVTGNIKARTVNGPVSIKDCAGTIDAQASNGPISFTGDTGEVKLRAENGPISVKVSKAIWTGTLLDARTSNGPLSLSLPSAFHSGVRVEANGGAPMSCRHDACTSAFRNTNGDKRTMQLNGTSETIRVSTTNGPISVGSSEKKAAL
jgi:hypothetical protein